MQMWDRAIDCEYDLVGQEFILATVIFQNKIAAIGRRYDKKIEARFLSAALEYGNGFPFTCLEVGVAEWNADLGCWCVSKKTIVFPSAEN